MVLLVGTQTGRTQGIGLIDAIISDAICPGGYDFIWWRAGYVPDRKVYLMVKDWARFQVSETSSQTDSHCIVIDGRGCLKLMGVSNSSITEISEI